MNERNQELIVDLLGGQLSPTEERSIRARIESDPDLRSEYETQMSIISLLDASSIPSMTTEERSTLHAALRQQLHLDDSPAPVVAAPSRWQRWLAPIGGFAVVAAVIVGAIVVLPGALSTDDSDGPFEVASAEITTTAASSSSDAVPGEVETQSTDDGGDGVTAPDVAESGLAGGTAADEEMQAYGGSYQPPEYFFTVTVGSQEFGKAQESGLLLFKDWMEISFFDQDGEPLAGEKYKVTLADGTILDGELDGDGLARIEDVPPGPVQVEFPDSPGIILVQSPGRFSGVLRPVGS